MISDPKVSKLQNILLKPSFTNSENLYFSGMNYGNHSNGIYIKFAGVLDFYSYFNLFSWKKWSQYTDIKSLGLRLNLKGESEIVFYSWDISGEKKEIYSTFVSGDNLTQIDIPSHLLSGQISFKIIPVRETLFISGEWISTDLPFTREINMAAVICTYKNDHDLFRNLELIKNNLSLNLELFIIDNDSRIKKEALNYYGPEFHLFHNPNTGSSGGFARGIIQASLNKSNFSHIILMYDDIQLEPDSINRSITLLRHLKPEYKNYFISGTMFHIDKPYLMLESIPAWNGFRIKKNYSNRDILDPKSIGQLDRDYGLQNQFSPWSFCAFPLTEKIKEDLPFPFFIYGDDMDYSFRHAEGFLSLNGIGVWLKPVHKKFDSFFRSYFFCRNTLILNSLHISRFSFFSSMLNALSKFFTQLFVHNYEAARFSLMAVEDFLEGAEYVIALNEPELLKKYSDSIETTNYKKSFREIFLLLLKSFSLSFYFLFAYKKAARSFRHIKRNQSFWTKRFYAREEVLVRNP